MLFFLLTLAIGCFSPSSFAASPWGMNDVSILLPLPDEASRSFMLRPQTVAQAGELLPRGQLDLLPKLARGLEGAELPSRLMVVGLRIDPCFRFGTETQCHRQVRLVWQPLTPAGQEVSTLDAAVHTFYELSPDEFSALTRKLAELIARTRLGQAEAPQSLPLQIHPVIAQQGLSGAYWRELRAIVLAYTGGRRLSRMTFMTLDAPGMMWDFAGFEIRNGKPSRLLIPRILARQQSFINRLPEDAPGFRGGARPAPPEGMTPFIHDDAADSADTLTRITSDSSSLGPADAAILRAEVDSAFRIENPRLNTPETIDCASCHAAQAARRWASERFPELDLGNSRFKFLAAPGFDLSNLSEQAEQASSHIVRAFGYQGRLPAISQRAINESAEVAQALSGASALLPARQKR